MSQSPGPENPFLKLSWIEFLAVQTLVIAFFPVSLAVVWLAFGSRTTAQLVRALIVDWVQTLFVLLGLLVLLFGGLIWGIVSWL